MIFEIGYYNKENRRSKFRVSAKNKKEALNALAIKIGVKKEWVKELVFSIGRGDESGN